MHLNDIQEFGDEAVPVEGGVINNSIHIEIGSHDDSNNDSDFSEDIKAEDLHD